MICYLATIFGEYDITHDQNPVFFFLPSDFMFLVAHMALRALKLAEKPGTKHL